MKRYLTTKLGGAKMVFIGLGGIVLNEILYRLILEEIYTTNKANNLPKGYVQKGLGHVFRNQERINEGRERIKESRLESKHLNQMVTRGKN